MALYILRLCNLCQAKHNLSILLCSVQYRTISRHRRGRESSFYSPTGREQPSNMSLATDPGVGPQGYDETTGPDYDSLSDADADITHTYSSPTEYPLEDIPAQVPLNGTYVAISSIQRTEGEIETQDIVQSSARLVELVDSQGSPAQRMDIGISIEETEMLQETVFRQVLSEQTTGSTLIQRLDLLQAEYITNDDSHTAPYQEVLYIEQEQTFPSLREQPTQYIQDRILHISRSVERPASRRAVHTFLHDGGNVSNVTETDPQQGHQILSGPWEYYTMEPVGNIYPWDYGM